MLQCSRFRSGVWLLLLWSGYSHQRSVYFDSILIGEKVIGWCRNKSNWKSKEFKKWNMVYLHFYDIKKFQEKKEPTLKRCKKHICKGKVKAALKKVKPVYKRGLVSLLFLKKWRNHPYINSKWLNTFSFISHSLFIIEFTRLKKKKFHFPRRIWPKFAGSARRYTALRFWGRHCT